MKLSAIGSVQYRALARRIGDSFHVDEINKSCLDLLNHSRCNKGKRINNVTSSYDDHGSKTRKQKIEIEIETEF